MLAIEENKATRIPDYSFALLKNEIPLRVTGYRILLFVLDPAV